LPEEYTFERISPVRLKDIQYLYKACFNEDVSGEFLAKKYDTKNFGAENTGYIAYDNQGSPAAYYGVFPCRVIADGKTYLAAQSGDTMTHPAHRGKGLFIKLANETYALAKELGIKFVFGFPNENSYPGFVKKLGWKHEENLNIYKIKVLTFPAGYICNKAKILREFYKWYSGLILKSRLSKKKYFENPLTSKSEGLYGIERSSDFFDYKKYMSKYLAEVNGKCVYLKAASALRVGDVEKCTEEEFDLIVKKLKSLARLLGNYAVIFYCSPGVNYDNYLKKKYTASEGLPIGWVDFGSGLDLSKLKFTQADLDTY
jgi:GNAT superfamily N-acetyltransferase